MDEKMRCLKCSARMFLDRIYTENRNYEVYCLTCGRRDFISKSSEFGEWLTSKEASLSASLL